MQSVEEALADLARSEPDAAADARVVWQALTDGQGPEWLDQRRVQWFCWSELPAWDRDTAFQLRAAYALAALLEGVGLHRYAEIAAGATTREVLEAARTGGPDRAASVARRAAARSGVEPPATELVTWGARQGRHESAAAGFVGQRLELAVAARVLVPGGRGWRDHQAELTLAALAEPRPELDGRSWYDVVLDERLEHWVQGGSTTRSGLLTPLADRLREPVVPPRTSSARSMLRPLAWLLAEVGDGLMLTAAGYLPPRTVASALDTLGWRRHLLTGATREVDAYPVQILRESAQRMGLLRRRAGRLVPTRAGRGAGEDARTLWAEVASHLVGAEDSALATAAETVLALLEPGEPVLERDARELVQCVVVECGWRLRSRRDDEVLDTGPLFSAVLHELRWLDLLVESGGMAERRLSAGPGAPALFRAALQYRVLHRDVVV